MARRDPTRPSRWSPLAIALAVSLVAVGLTPAPTAAAGVVTVNSTDNDADTTPGDGVCNTGQLNSQSAAECTLRAAIAEANASAIDTIAFAMPATEAGHAGGVWTISPTSGLPTIAAPATIDATTQPGWTADPVVRLNGVGAGAASGLSIGGAADGSTVAGFMITRFNVDGVNLANGANAVTVTGNWIGSNGSGAAAMGNGDDGIDIRGASAVIAGNVVNHSGDEGIDVRAGGAVITGNLVGLEPDGAGGSGNSDVGIALFGANTTIGGSTDADRNVISMNWEAIEVNTSGNVIRGNYIGTDDTGTLDRGNRIGDGIEVQSGTGNVIGGTGAGQGNVIAHNQVKGVDVTGGTASVLGNDIHSNGGLGIDLGATGVTGNDAGDGDTGPNDLLNFPVITSAVAWGGSVTVTYDLDVPAGTYRVEFFDSGAADPSGHGEGETFRSAVTTSPGTGLTHTFAGAAADILTATATRDLGGGSFGPTSEFSLAVTAVPGTVTVNSSDDDPDASPGDDLCDTGQLNSAGDPECTLRAAIAEVNASATMRAIEFAIPGTDPRVTDSGWTIPVGTSLPAISDAATIDGTTQPGWTDRPVIELDGSALVGSGDGLQVSGTDTTITGLAVGGFPDTGLRVAAGGATVTANHLGVAADGVTPAPNGDGIAVVGNVADVTIGGLAATDANVIAGNAGAGVAITGAGTTGVSVIGNRIADNGGLGIDLGDDGVTANDADTDADAGPNGLLNTPIVTAAAETTPGSVDADASIRTNAGTFRLEWFTNPGGADPSGSGEGELLVHTQVVNHPGGTATYSATLPTGGSDPLSTTLTACDAAACADPGATSEFSPTVAPTPVGGTTRPLLDSTANRADGRTAGSMTAGDLVAGQLGDGLDFDGADDQVLLDNLDVDGSAVTISAWVRPDTGPEDARIVTKEASGAPTDQHWTTTFDDGPVLRAQVAQDAGGGITGPASPATGAWTHVTGTWDGSQLRLYQDGAPIATGAQAGAIAPDPTIVTRVAGAPDVVASPQSRQLDGRLDEIRVAVVDRSAAWIAAEHANQSDPATFVSLGATETRATGPWTVSAGTGRGGSQAAEAPDTSPGSWLLAAGLDEPGLLVDAWWKVSTLAGVEVAQGMRTVEEPGGPVQDESALLAASGWDLGQMTPSGRTQLVAPPAGQSPTAATWHRVETRIDEGGELVVAIDGTQTVPASGTTPGGLRPSGTFGFRVGALPSGQDWWLDDVRARRYVTPEPTTSVGPVVVGP